MIIECYKLEEYFKISFSGIYCIINSITGKIYIGSSKNISQRIRGHLKDLKANKHRNLHLQNSYNLYGSNSFYFCCVETCCNDILIEKEQFWMNKSQCYDRKFGYNIIPKSDRREFSDEHKLRLSKSHIGNKHTKESIEKIRYHSLIRKYPSFSKPVLQFDKFGKFIQEYPSILEAGKINNWCKENISACCSKKNNQKKAYGYIWVFKSDCINNELTMEELKFRNSKRSDKGIIKSKKKSGIEVLRINIDKSFVKYYSISEACRKENIDRYTFEKSAIKKDEYYVLYADNIYIKNK